MYGNAYTFPTPGSADPYAFTSTTPPGTNANQLRITPIGAGQWLTTTVANNALTFQFGAGVSAVGGEFGLAEFSLVSGTYSLVSTGTITLSLDDGTTEVIALSPQDASPFRGFFSSTAISSLTFQGPSGSSIFAAVNSLIVGAAVPEPGSLALVAIGLGVLAGTSGLRRRRRACGAAS